MRCPNPDNVDTFAAVAGWVHIFVFMAGAHITGARVASSTVLARSEAPPDAARDIRFAVPGATTTRSGQSASSM